MVLSLDQLRTALSDPNFAAKQINRRFSRYILIRFRPPCNFFKEDWDNLLILDACRYDLICESDLTRGNLEYRWSGGSNSEEFIRYNTTGETLDDVVWVTANPWVSKYREAIFRVIDIWDKGWNDDLNTVDPHTMKDAAMKAADDYPDKRLVIHFMQPHYPFIGNYGRRQLPDHRTFIGDGIVDQDVEAPSIWDLLRQGVVSKDNVWRAYRENFKLVFPVALDLEDQLGGKSVITADHGNLFGERLFPIPIREYGHPSQLRIKSLVKVPWIVFDSKDRRRIRSSSMNNLQRDTEQTAEDRLKTLGYKI